MLAGLSRRLKQAQHTSNTSLYHKSSDWAETKWSSHSQVKFLQTWSHLSWDKEIKLQKYTLPFLHYAEPCVFKCSFFILPSNANSFKKRKSSQYRKHMKHQRTPNLQSIILFSLVKLSGHTNSEWLCFHLSWVNKTSSSIINHHDHEWCHRIVTISFSLMLRQIVFSVEPDYTSFSKYPFKKDYSGFLIVSKTTTEVHLDSHSVGPYSQDKIRFISFYSHTVNAWMCSKIHVVPHRLRGLFPKRKHLWHCDTQLCSWPVRRRHAIVSCA